MKMDKKSSLLSFAGWIILIVPLTFFVLSIGMPVLSNLIISLQHTNIYGPGEFVGFRNYDQLFKNEYAKMAFFHTFASPLFFLRILLLVAAPLAFACLLLELRSGGRLLLQIIIGLFLVYSSSVILAIMYKTYYAMPGGLANSLLLADGKEQIPFLASEEHLPGIVNNFLLANGLALSLPLGLVLYLSVMRGVQWLALDKSRLYQDFWAKAWRLLVVCAFATVGFSFAGLANAFLLNPPPSMYDNLLVYAFNTGFRNMKFGEGAAANELIILLSFALGLLMMLFLEYPGARISLRLLPRGEDKLLAGSKFGTARLFGIIVSCLVVIAVLIAALNSFVLPCVGSILSFFSTQKPVPSRFIDELTQSLFRSARVGLPAALLGLLSAMTAGFALGYLKPVGSKLLLILIGAFMFVTPVLLLIPFYLFFMNMGLRDTLTTQLFPLLCSPFGLLLFTWFFRGLREEGESLAADTRTVVGRLYRKRVLGGLILFSLPVFTLYLLSFADMTLFPFSMINSRDILTAPVIVTLGFNDFMNPIMTDNGSRVHMGMIYALQYLLPVGLFISSLIFLFPRLALVFRKNSDTLPALDREFVNNITQDGTSSPESITPVAKQLLPGRQVWISIFPLFFFILGLCILILSCFVPTLILGALFMILPAAHSGGIVYYIYVYQIHRALAVASGYTYPHSPAAAILFHFVPVFNLYWLYRWTKDVALYVDQHNPRRLLLPGLFLFIFYLAQLVICFTVLLLAALFGISLLAGRAEDLTSAVSLITVVAYPASLISTVVQIGVSLYLADGVRKTLAAE